MDLFKTEVPENKTMYRVFWRDNGKRKSILFLAALEMDRQLASVIIFMSHYQLKYYNSNRNDAEKALEVYDLAHIEGHKITKLTFKCEN